MKFKYDLHCHTSPVSYCAADGVKDIIKAYISKGYNGVVITNHINTQTFMRQPTSRWKDLMKYYLSDYYNALKYANGKLTVFLGTEISFRENHNDYLLYGVTEDFLMSNEHLMHLNIRDFSQLAHENGVLLFQAHPFRNNMTITRPELLDGIEVYNGHPRHNSRNDFAALWRDRYDLLYSAGSDTHSVDDIGSGILTDVELKDNNDLVEILKIGNFEIIRRSRQGDI